MDEEEAKALIKKVLERASPQYLNPGPELLGKFLVCQDYQILSVFESEEEAQGYVASNALSPVEIRHPYAADGGVAVKVIVPNAIKYVGD